MRRKVGRPSYRNGDAEVIHRSPPKGSCAGLRSKEFNELEDCPRSDELELTAIEQNDHAPGVCSTTTDGHKYPNF